MLTQRNVFKSGFSKVLKPSMPFAPKKRRASKHGVVVTRRDLVALYNSKCYPHRELVLVASGVGVGKTLFKHKTQEGVSHEDN